MSAARCGLVLGKFLPYHAGHAHLIRTARSQVDVLTVLVCSIAREPIPGATRFAWVAESHPDCRVMHVAEEVPQAPAEHPEFWRIWTDLVRRHAGAINLVFTSEDYGDELARRLGARHVCVDLARNTYPVSGTAIRDDPLGHWDYIPPVVRPSYVHRVAILGTESTGKTTLAQQLAEAFRTTWVPEYGRAYCEGRDPRDLTPDDFDAIGRGQILAEESIARSANRVLICDTDVRTTATWSDIILGTRSAWLSRAAAGCEYGHALLLDDDVPWMNDGTRVLRDERTRHTDLLERELRTTHQLFTRIQGPFEQRFQQAATVIDSVLRMPVRPRFDVTGAEEA
jgi:HTH-type transcriptional regulator, transcriptional repressor of NAD biosynthesis genes